MAEWLLHSLFPLSVIALNPAVASASPPLELVGNTLSSQGGLQARTVPAGAAAAYFNPALLIDSPAGLGVGVVVLRQDISITLRARPGPQVAVPENLENAGRADGSRFDSYAIATNLLENGREQSAVREAFRARPRQAAGTGHETLRYTAFGLNIHLFEDYLALGFHALIPSTTFTRLAAFFNDEREQYFSNSLHPELYSDRMTAISVAMGGGLKLTERLSLGVGATIGLQSSINAPTFVNDTGALDEILVDIDSPVSVSVSPHFGASYRPMDQLRITATAHAPKRLELGSSFTFLLANGIEQSSGITFVLDYMPWQLGLGSAWTAAEGPVGTVTLAASLLYAKWSDYRDRHGDRPSPAYAWFDTFSATAGVRYRWRSLDASADVGYSPSPVPEQTGRTNYVDNDRVSAGIGLEYGWELWGTQFRLGAQFQAHHLLRRENTKRPTPTSPDGENIAPELVTDEVPDDAQVSGMPVPGIAGLQTNNPGFPGFQSTGWVSGGSLHLTVAF